MKRNFIRLSAVAIACAALGTIGAEARTYAMKVNLKGKDAVTHTVASVAKLTFTAAGNTKMIVTPTAGSDMAVSLNGVDQLTFEGNNVVMGTTSLPLSSIKQVTFDITTGLEDVTLGDNLTVAAVGGILTATDATGAAVALEVYGIQGTLLASAKGDGSASVDLNTIAGNVLIVKANNKVIKINR